MKNVNLLCTACGEQFDMYRVNPRCEICGEPLEVQGVTEGKVRKWEYGMTMLERYGDFLPFRSTNPALTLGEGTTPLIHSPRLAELLGIKKFLIKNESQNPTWSFKDRGTAAGIQHAVKLGFDRIGTISSGNMAASVAAYGARAGLKTIVMVSSTIPGEKIGPIAIHKPSIIMVAGDYGSLYFKSLEIGETHGIYFINSDVPLRVEGSKTIAFEICEDTGFEIPDYVAVPTSAGGNIRGVMKGFNEFKRCGLIEKVPTFICAQAQGCAPIFEAFKTGRNEISRVKNPKTIAHAIENPFPPSGNEVLRKIRAQGGIVTAVSENEIIEAQQELAGEGLFLQPAAAVPYAAVRKIRSAGKISQNDSVVMIASGSGLKYTAVFQKYGFPVTRTSMESLEEHVESLLHEP